MERLSVAEENNINDVVQRMMDHVDCGFFRDQVRSLDEDALGDAFSEKGVRRATEMAMQIVAQLVSRTINAGSEREAVMEDSVLEDALFAQFTSWRAEE